jgi:very-short-patch-repair endonuclease
MTNKRKPIKEKKPRKPTRIRATTEEIRARGKAMFGDLYNYDNTEYIDCKIKMGVFCNKCKKEFWVTPDSHFNNRSGCPSCKCTKKLTTETLIEKCIELYGDKFSYEETRYESYSAKTKFFCKGCNEMKLYAPKVFLKGGGCKECKKREIQAELLEKARLIHGNIYDYSLVKYEKNSIPVTIICPAHGEFEQNLYDHSKGHKCFKCSGHYTKTTEEWIIAAILIHGNLYDYSLVDYRGNSIKVKIICPIHGVFEQLPGAHLSGKGCHKCSGVYKKTFDQFQDKANIVHNFRYTYNNFVYVNTTTKGFITCPIHGDFEQTPSQHILGHRCPKCRFYSKGEARIREFLIEKGIKFEEQKTFKGCKHKIKLRFDFYLPDRNLLIEFQGEQHYKPVSIFGGEKSFELCQIRDTIKREFCQKEGITLLEIKPEELEEILYDLHQVS